MTMIGFVIGQALGILLMLLAARTILRALWRILGARRRRQHEDIDWARRRRDVQFWQHIHHNTDSFPEREAARQLLEYWDEPLDEDWLPPHTPSHLVHYTWR